MDRMVYGECETPASSARVRISQLAARGCDLESESPGVPTGGEFNLWIGAMGPFAATARSKGHGQFAVDFKAPLDGKILDHFNA